MLGSNLDSLAGHPVFLMSESSLQPLFAFFEAGSLVDQDSLTMWENLNSSALLLLPPKCWNYKLPGLVLMSILCYNLISIIPLNRANFLCLIFETGSDYT